MAKHIHYNGKDKDKDTGFDKGKSGFAGKSKGKFDKNYGSPQLGKSGFKGTGKTKTNSGVDIRTLGVQEGSLAAAFVARLGNTTAEEQ